MGQSFTCFNSTKTLTLSHNESISTISPRSPSLQKKEKKRNSQTFSIIFKKTLTSHNDSVSGNGVTGIHISSKVVAKAVDFWKKIEKLSNTEKLEIACAIFFRLILEDRQISKFFTSNNKSLETISLQFLNMIGWLITNLDNPNVNLIDSVHQLGKLHQNLGTKPTYYHYLLQSLHFTMVEYYPVEYEMDVRFSIDQIMAFTTRVMTNPGKLDQIGTGHFNPGESPAKDNDYSFLKSLPHCMAHTAGRQYLYRFLGQSWCSEITVFLQMYSRYEIQQSDCAKFIVAKQMQVKCINPGSLFEINLPHNCRVFFLQEMKRLQTKYDESPTQFVMETDVIEPVKAEVYSLISSQRWKEFVKSFRRISTD